MNDARCPGPGEASPQGASVSISRNRIFTGRLLRAALGESLRPLPENNIKSRDAPETLAQLGFGQVKSAQPARGADDIVGDARADTTQKTDKMTRELVYFELGTA